MVTKKQVIGRSVAASAILALAATAMSLAPSTAYKLGEGPLFDVAETLTLPDPYALEDTEGSWNVLTVRADRTSALDEYLMRLTGKADDLYMAATPAGMGLNAAKDAEKPLSDKQLALNQALSARQLALNLASQHTSGTAGYMAVTESDTSSIEVGTRILSIDGTPPTPGVQPAGEWLVVTNDGSLRMFAVAEGFHVEANAQELREHPTPDIAVAPAADAVNDDAFDLLEVGGSSSGLLQTLAWADILTAGDLTKGHDIAATGMVTQDGKVLPVAGVKFKLRAAQEAGIDLVIAPVGATALAPEGLLVIEVSDVDDAFAVLQALGQDAR